MDEGFIELESDRSVPLEELVEGFFAYFEQLGVFEGDDRRASHVIVDDRHFTEGISRPENNDGVFGQRILVLPHDLDQAAQYEEERIGVTPFGENLFSLLDLYSARDLFYLPELGVRELREQLYSFQFNAAHFANKTAGSKIPIAIFRVNNYLITKRQG